MNGLIEVTFKVHGKHFLMQLKSNFHIEIVYICLGDQIFATLCYSIPEPLDLAMRFVTFALTLNSSCS